jgi:hypothetical protein
VPKPSTLFFESVFYKYAVCFLLQALEALVQLPEEDNNKHNLTVNRVTTLSALSIAGLGGFCAGA